MIALTVPYMADGLAENAETKGEFEKALRLRTLAYHMSLAKDGKLALRSIQARGGLISPLVRLGRLDKAIEIEEGVIRDLEDLDAHPPQILVQQLLQLGRLYRQHGDLGRAISTTREALALGGELNGASGRRYDDRPRPEGFPSGFVVEAIGELADLYDAAGDFDRALVYRHRMVALDLLDDPEQYLNGDMDCYVALADLEARFGRRDLSLAAGSYVFRKAKADAGQRDKAEPIVRPITVPESTERVFGPPDRSSIIGLGFLRLGDAYWLTGGRFTNAEPFYEAALASGLGSTGPGTNLPMRAAARLAMSRWVFGKDEGNLELLKRAAGLDREGPQESKFLIVDRDTLSMFENAYLGTLDWYAKRGSIDETQRVREAAELYAAIERADTFGRAFQLASIRRESKEKSQLAAVQKWIEARATFDQGVRRETAAAEGRARPSEKQLFAERESSEAAATRLAQAESVLNTEFPDHKSFDDRRLSAQDLIDGVRLHIDDDEMVVDLLPARHAIWALVITRDNVKLTHFNVNDTILTQKIRAMRAALDPHILTRATDREQAFHKIDVKSLAEMWPYTLGLFGSEALSKRRWIIIAHDLMRSVPLEAIPLSIEVSDDSAAVAAQPELWPGLSHEISYLPSLSALLDLRTALRVSAAPNTAFVVADPVLPGDIRHDSVAAQSLDRLQDWERRQRLDIGKWLGSGGDFAPIPETATLGYNILAQLGGDSNSMYAGQRAVRSGILTSRDITRSRTVLFATHAVTADAFPDIAEPFLVLTPEEAIAPFGALTMSDIAGLNLDAELVILSACNTAAPDGTPGRSGFSGLAQAFIEAGARSLLVTQWEIQTGPAEEAITETIRTALLGARPAEAIRRGRLAAAAKFGHPSYWAAFVFVGDPGRPWKLK